LADALSAFWYVYMIQTECGKLYTGITVDIDRRFAEHLGRYSGRSQKGARYFCGRKPQKVVYRERAKNRAEALRREYAIKQLSAKEKRLLVANHTIEIAQMADGSNE